MDLSHKCYSYKIFLTRELVNIQLVCQENFFIEHGSQLCCVLESIEKLLEILMPGPHFKPILSKSPGVGLKHQSILKFSKWFLTSKQDLRPPSQIILETVFLPKIDSVGDSQISVSIRTTRRVSLATTYRVHDSVDANYSDQKLHIKNYSHIDSLGGYQKCRIGPHPSTIDI